MQDDAAAARPPILAEPSRRVPGLLVDALHQIDQVSSEAEQAQVDALILQEMEAMAREGITASTYLAELPSLSTASASGAVGEGVAITPAIDAGLRDIAAGKKLLASLPPASFSSVFDHVQPPPPTTSSSTDQLVSAWESSVAKAQVAVEAQTLRSINVELATRYSVEQWKASVDSLAKAEEDAKTRVQRLQDETRKVQETRKATQERARGTLQTLGKRKYAAIASINGVAPAVAEAKHEAKRLKALAVQHGLVPEDYGDDEDADADGQIEAVSVI